MRQANVFIFFPRPRLFFLSAVLWTAAGAALWYSLGRSLGPRLSLGWLLDFGYPSPLSSGADEAQQAANAVAINLAVDVWLYQYMIVVGAIFAAFWALLAPHRWFWWLLVGSSVILFIVWFQVELDVMINNWFGGFYDLIQKALGTPNSVTIEEYFSQLVTFFTIAAVYIAVAVGNAFLVSHYIFRWRTAMNDYYVAYWGRLRRIEGASQRVGGHHAVRSDRRGSWRQSGEFGYDARRLSAHPVGPVCLCEGAAVRRQRAAGTRLCRDRLVGLRHGTIGSRGNSVAWSQFSQPACRGGVPEGTGDR